MLEPDVQHVADQCHDAGKALVDGFQKVADLVRKDPLRHLSLDDQLSKPHSKRVEPWKSDLQRMSKCLKECEALFTKTVERDYAVARRDIVARVGAEKKARFAYGPSDLRTYLDGSSNYALVIRLVRALLDPNSLTGNDVDDWLEDHDRLTAGIRVSWCVDDVETTDQPCDNGRQVLRVRVLRELTAEKLLRADSIWKKLADGLEEENLELRRPEGSETQQHEELVRSTAVPNGWELLEILRKSVTPPVSHSTAHEWVRRVKAVPGDLIDGRVYADAAKFRAKASEPRSPGRHPRRK